MTDDWKAVATAIDQRLVELDLELRELARRSKVSESTIRELRYNTVQRRRSPRTLTDISLGLGWPPDHLKRVLSGSVPDEPDPPSDQMATRLDAIDRRLDEMHSLLLTVAREVSELRRSAHGERDAGR